jgi:hypothetical protein
VKAAADLLLDLPASSRVVEGSIEEGGIDDVVQVVLVAGAELAQVRRVHHERERVLVGQALFLLRSMGCGAGLDSALFDQRR